MSILVLPVPRSAVLLAEKKKPVADAKAAATPGKTICVVKPIPLTILPSYPWHKGSNSTYNRLRVRVSPEFTGFLSIHWLLTLHTQNIMRHHSVIAGCLFCVLSNGGKT